MYLPVAYPYISTVKLSVAVIKAISCKINPWKSEFYVDNNIKSECIHIIYIGHSSSSSNNNV